MLGMDTLQRLGLGIVGTEGVPLGGMLQSPYGFHVEQQEHTLAFGPIGLVRELPYLGICKVQVYLDALVEECPEYSLCELSFS